MIFHFSARNSNGFSLFQSNDLLLFVNISPYKTSSKQFENSPASVKSKIQFTTPAKRSFPGQYDPSPAFTARQRNFPRQV